MTYELRIVRELKAKPARVYFVWSEADAMRRWISAHSEVSLDPVVGGALSIDMRDQRKSHLHQGRFLVVDPPHRLVFTWTSEATRDTETTVAIEIRPSGSGTELTLVHEGLLDEDMRDDHGLGWAEILDALEDYLSL